MTPKPVTPIQELLLAHWRQCVKDVKAAVKGYGLSLNLGGDLVEGNHHDHYTGLTHKEMRELALELFRPYANMADAIYSVGGTEAHAGMEAEDDAQVAKEMGCKPEHMGWSHRIRYNGRLLDWEHHGASVSKLPWNETNGLHSLIKQVYTESRFAGEPAPDLIMRHHNHRVPVGDYVYDMGVMASIGPCWKWRDGFGHRLGLRRPPTIGVTIWYPAEKRLKVLRYAIEAKTIDAARSSAKYTPARERHPDYD